MKKWYIAQTYSGFESSVKDDLERRIANYKKGDVVTQVLVPEEEYEVLKKDGSKSIKKRKIFPGYIFVETETDADMDENVWYIIRNTQKVTGFLGSSGGGTKPTPVRDEEINQMLKSIGKLQKTEFDFVVGEEILIVNGSWSNKKAEISSINEEKEVVTVLVEIFGRSTPTELSFADIKKIN
ncbi:MAG: transcription termination/antitermination protein NusG [Anaeroplasmataceae bacterium]